MRAGAVIRSNTVYDGMLLNGTHLDIDRELFKDWESLP